MGVEQQIAHVPVRLPAGTRLLIVEDQPFVALAVADMIDALGGEVAAMAATVEDAIAAIDRETFTATLLDVDLGGNTSEPVAAALAAAHSPFLITTGFELRPFNRFADAPILLKPYLPSQLGRALIALLNGHAATASGHGAPAGFQGAALA